jgi:hypothetical protein
VASEYLIIYLYSDGNFDCDAPHKPLTNDALSLNELIRKGWKIYDKEPWRKSTTNTYWAITMLVRDEK